MASSWSAALGALNTAPRGPSRTAYSIHLGKGTREHLTYPGFLKRNCIKEIKERSEDLLVSRLEKENIRKKNVT